MTLETKWQSRKRQFLEFCDETSMHGFSDWRRSHLMRWFWVIIIIVFFGIAFYQIYTMMRKNIYDEPFKVETSPVLVPFQELQLPVVEICLANSISSVAASKLPSVVSTLALMHRVRSNDAVVRDIPELAWMQRAADVPTGVEELKVIREYLENRELQVEVDGIVLDMVIAGDNYEKVVDQLLNGINDSKSLQQMQANEAIELVVRMYAHTVNGTLPCAEGEYNCRDGSCIPLSYVNNNEFYCIDHSDEQNQMKGMCIARNNMFLCNDQRCIHSFDVCDGKTDCLDGSDEDVENNGLWCKSGRCSEDQFRCSDASCIPFEWYCNGKVDCPDRSDEMDGCNMCEFLTIAKDYVFSCADLAKETFGNSPVPRAADNECVTNKQLCDGVIQCGVGGWDEYSTRCEDHYHDEANRIAWPSDMEQCPNEMDVICVQILPYNSWDSVHQNTTENKNSGPQRKRCVNADVYCSDMETHVYGYECCNATCYHRKCGNNDDVRCQLITYQVLNHMVDPSNDTLLPPIPKAPDWCAYSFASNWDYSKDAIVDLGECIGKAAFCDQEKDCGNERDEKQCFDYSCSNTFDCGMLQCISLHRVCDGRHDCDSKRDEENCDELCPHGYLCLNGDCIKPHKQCNGVVDCSDASDETNCSTVCPTRQIACSNFNGVCVSEAKLCDGSHDCPDGSDEAVQCEDYCQNMTSTLTSLPMLTYFVDRRHGYYEWNRGKIINADPLMYRCPNGKCIRGNTICDYKDDCGDFWDESYCQDMRVRPTRRRLNRQVPSNRTELAAYVANLNGSRMLPEEWHNEKFDIIDLTASISLTVEQVFLRCAFASIQFNCSDYIEMVYNPDHGICYSVDVNLNQEYNQTAPGKGLFLMVHTNSRLLLDVNGGDQYYPTTSDGLTVMFTDVNGTESSAYFDVSPRTNTKFTLKRTNYNREVTENSKLDECFLREVYESVGCLPPLPKPWLVNDSMPICIRDADRLRLIRAIKRNDFKHHCDDQCRAACVETKYSATVTAKVFPSDELIRTVQRIPEISWRSMYGNDKVLIPRPEDLAVLADGFTDSLTIASFIKDYKRQPDSQQMIADKSRSGNECAYTYYQTLAAGNMRPDCADASHKLAEQWSKQLIAINLAYPDNEVTQVVYSRKMEFEDYFGAIGGFLGLWTGASIMSFIHLAVFLSQFAFPHLDPVADDAKPETLTKLYHTFDWSHVSCYLNVPPNRGQNINAEPTQPVEQPIRDATDTRSHDRRSRRDQWTTSSRSKSSTYRRPNPIY